MIVVFQTHPELLISIAKNNAHVRDNLGGNSGVEAIQYLNNLGATNYQKWVDTLATAGDVLYTPSNGWSTVYAFLRSGGSYYSLLHIGINICQTEIVAPPGISDLVLSNSYNDLPSNFLYTVSSGEDDMVAGATDSNGDYKPDDGFIEIEDEDVALDDSLGKTGYILIGESHISMSETAVINNGGIQTLSNGNVLTLGKDLFFIHTLFLNGTESKHNGSAGSYES